MLEHLLKSHGPCLSTDLVRLLIEDGLSADAARKRVSRGCTGLKRLAYLPFPRGARFTYLEADYNSPQYWDGLTKAILESDSSYSRAFAALLQRGGIVPRGHFAIACGAPLRQKKHLPPETVLDRLKKANIAEEVDVPGVGVCVSLARGAASANSDISDLRARLVVEAILLKALRMWLRNLGLASFNKIAVRDEGAEPPRVGTFAWDLSGPSYLAPIMEWRSNAKPSPGFIACDVLANSEVTETGIKPFLHKCKTLRSLKRVGRCLQIFVADRYSKEAFAKAKEAGIIPATPETLFGKEVAAALVQLTDLLTHTARVSSRPEVFSELFQSLGRIEGAATNLRGALFELVVAELVRRKLGTEITLNRVFANDVGEKAEVDVLAVQSNRDIYFIECKGYQPSGVVSDADVEAWLTRRIPLVRKEALQHPDWKNMRFHFEFWTTGKLSDVALATVRSAKAKTKKYVIEYRDAQAVHDYAQAVKDRSLISTLRQHFFKHPITTAELDAEKRMAREKRLRDAKNSDTSANAADVF